MPLITSFGCERGDKTKEMFFLSDSGVTFLIRMIHYIESFTWIVSPRDFQAIIYLKLEFSNAIELAHLKLHFYK